MYFCEQEDSLEIRCGFLETPLARIRSTVVPWMERNRKRSVECDEVRGPLSGLLEQLGPFEPSALPRELWLETQSPWIAHFSNSKIADPIYPIVPISRLIGCRGVVISCIKATERTNTRSKYKNVLFSMYGPQSSAFLGRIRIVQTALDEDRFIFGAAGETQPFEDAHRYSATDPSDRITPQMVRSYCESLGIRAFEPSFYGPSGVILR